ncbi:acyl-CoA dehydrogenase family protein [Amycolatopsis sp. GM8]|uniref:acyl-CoA dehydrogenase family protein n=1 Tax=Amycolatopsis sp. GM8 TaxID=2896530 RepID=UPI001F22B45E|nr:acyl-CoA dehydrogenase family protein [Amycolatopsis sp. GM8]
MTLAQARTGQVADRDSARRFVDEYVLPRATEFDRAGRVPEDVLAELSRAGLWAPFLPAGLGGSDVDMLTLGRIHEEIGRGCSSVRSLLTVHTMVTWAVRRWGTETQRAYWLPRFASGAALGAFCLTEPGAGSDTARITTTARRAGDGWTLDGVKKWITCGQRADVFLVFAKTGQGIAAFLVPSDASGVEVRPITDVLGTRASMLAEVVLTGVETGPDALVGPDGFASGMVMSGTLDLGRFSVAAGSVGIVRACLDACVGYTSQRSVEGRPLRDFQLIKAKITNMVTDLQAGRLLYERAGRLKDEGDAATIMATWVAKYFASTAAARHAGEAVQIHGANGFGPGHPVERLFRDSKVMEIIEGSSEVQQVTIATQAYGEGVA